MTDSQKQEDEMKFFDRYDIFYKTTGTRLLPNRLHQRYKAIIDNNLDLFSNKRVLDLASHDGRWTFAALKAGACYALGVEARTELVERGRNTFSTYSVLPSEGQLIVGDVEDYLGAADAEKFDVVLCLGFFYHTMHHMKILELMRNTDADTFIIDTAVSPTSRPVIDLYNEKIDDVRNSVDYAATGAVEAPVGVPSRQAIEMMLAYLGYDFREIPWRSFCNDWSECEDYEKGNRGTFVAKRKR